MKVDRTDESQGLQAQSDHDQLHSTKHVSPIYSPDIRFHFNFFFIHV